MNLCRDFVHSYGSVLEGPTKRVCENRQRSALNSFGADCSEANRPVGRLLLIGCRKDGCGKACDDVGDGRAHDVGGVRGVGEIPEDCEGD